ncbi:MAG: PAS domain-containing sensor histidine kinase [Bacteroidales bacterium]|nr:PAS domain-containing sensor histidine kinase [Bacteroidales bacterium]
MNYTVVSDSQILIDGFVEYDGNCSSEVLENASGLFIRVFGANSEIALVSRLLEIEILAVVREPYGQRSGFFLEHSDRKFDGKVVSMALDCIANPSRSVRVLYFADNTCGVAIPVWVGKKCAGYIMSGAFIFEGDENPSIVHSVPVIPKRRIEYAVSKVVETASKILEYSIRYVSDGGLGPKIDYDSIFKYGNYYDFNLLTDTYILSRATGEILGLEDPTSCTLERFYSMIVPEDRSRVAMLLKDLVLIAGEPFTIETQIVRPRDGKKVWIEIKGVTVKDENNFAVRVLGSVHDITALRTAQKRLEEEIETKNRLMRIVGHDLKNPFNSLIGFAGLLSEALESGDYNGAKEFSEIIRTSASEGYDLLVNLLDYSNSLSGDLTVDIQELPLCQIVESVVDLISSQAYRKSIKLDNSVGRDVKIFADEYKISTVIRNLVSNAVKFSFEGTTVKISAQTFSDGRIKVSVSNSGAEIQEEVLRKINSGFAVSSTLGTDGEKGTGFGLRVCSEFLGCHNSRLNAVSGNGVTVFSFII